MELGTGDGRSAVCGYKYVWQANAQNGPGRHCQRILEALMHVSARRTTGVILIASGGIGITIGFALTATGVGAVCGIPLILLGIITIIWGYLMKAKDKALREERLGERMLMTQAVASGVNLCPKCKTPNSAFNPRCSGCGFEFVPLGDPRPISAIDPADAALKIKQVNDWRTPVVDPDDLQ
jgi:hypothetical protein